MSENTTETKTREQLIEDLKEMIFSSESGKALEKAPDQKAEVIKFVEALSDREAEGLIALSNYREKVTVNPKKVPLAVVSTGEDGAPRGARFASAEEKKEIIGENPELFDSFQYERKAPNIADFIVLFASSLDHSDADQEEPQDYLDEIEKIFGLKKFSAVKTKETLLLTDKLSQVVKNHTKDGSFNVNSAKSSSPKKIREKVTLITLSPEDDGIITTGDVRFTDYDCSMHEGYLSSRLAGNEAITGEMIFRAANGMEDGSFVTPEQAAKAIESIEKWRKNSGKVDATEAYNAYCRKNGGEEIESYTIEGAFIECERHTVKLNGQIREAYVAGEGTPLPLLYRHATLLNHIQRFSPDMLNIPTISNTETNISLRRYLLLQINRVKDGKNNKIAFQPIYDRFPVTDRSGNKRPRNRKEQGRLRDDIKKMLDYWTSKKHIKGWKYYKTGKTITGAEIFF